MKIQSSNVHKIREYASFGLNLIAVTGPDLPEVQGTDEEVILYKTLMSPTDTLVEDTSLVISGMDVGVNVRWLMDDLKNNPTTRDAEWVVWIGVHDGQTVKTIRGAIPGKIVPARGEGFGFDAIFQPEGSEYTLAELDMMDQKHLYSARKDAVKRFLDGQFDRQYDVALVPEWKGDWQ